MRVAFDLISETGQAGGIRTYWTELIARLARQHSGDHWSLFGSEDLIVPSNIASLPNVDVVSIGKHAGSATRRRLRQQLTLPPALHAGGFDLVHSVNNVLPLALALPRVLTVLDWTLRHTPDRFSIPKRLFLNTLIPWSVRHADHVIAISRATRRDLEEGIVDLDPSALSVIHLGVDDRFDAISPAGEDTELRQRYELPDRFTLFVGAPEPGKNVEGMLEALEILGREMDEPPPLVVVGGGGWGGVIEKLERARHLPVRWLGRVPDQDLPGLYRAAHVFLFPSLWEGFGLPVLEAFASGTPVVTSDRSALPEVAGRAALLVSPHDPDELARAWRALWLDDELHRRLREQGLARAAVFDWDRVARETYEVYRTVLAGQSSELAIHEQLDPTL